jgi:predicted permease
MSIGSVLLNVMGPVALLVALGSVTGPRLGIDGPTLSRLAYWILGPAFVFSLLAGADLDAAVLVDLVVVAAGAMAAAGLTALAFGVATGAGFEARAVMAMSSMWGNVGNAGLAIVAFALGDEALPFAAVLMVTINLLSLVISVGLAQARTASPAAAIRRALTAPMSLAGAAALAVNLGGLGLPLVGERAVDLLAGAMIPIMLYSLGLQLVVSGRPRLSTDLVVVSTAKLVIAPAAAAALAVVVGLEGDARGAAIIQSAMPPAVFTAVVAAENDLLPERATAAVVVATLGALVTLPVVLLAT